jgi:DnaJ-class molecular chaperone
MVLEVDQTTTTELIIRAYKRLALKLHPDRNARHDATETFQRVCQIFVGLANPLVNHQIISAEIKHYSSDEPTTY